MALRTLPRAQPTLNARSEETISRVRFEFVVHGSVTLQWAYLDDVTDGLCARPSLRRTKISSRFLVFSEEIYIYVGNRLITFLERI